MSAHPLVSWIEENMPELDKRLTAVSEMDKCRVVLNEVTGLDVKSDDLRDETMDAFLVRLKELHAAKKQA